MAQRLKELSIFHLFKMQKWMGSATESNYMFLIQQRMLNRDEVIAFFRSHFGFLLFAFVLKYQSYEMPYYIASKLEALMKN